MGVLNRVGMGFERHEEATPTWAVDDDGKADFDNIQAAVDAASDGDELIVMPGLAIRLYEKGWTGEHLAKLFGGNLKSVFLGEKITKE